MRYDLAIFDLDGTLADSFAFFVQAQQRLAARHGFRPIAADELPRLRHASPRALMRHVGLPRWRLPWVARDFIAMVRTHGHAIALFDGVADRLADLHARGLRLAVVTSNAPDNARRALGDDLLARLCHLDGGASIFGKHRRIARALRATGVDPARAVYVGDQTTDAEAARRAGVHFAAVAWGYASPESLMATAPAHLFHHVHDLRHLAGPARRRAGRLQDHDDAR